MGSSESLGAKGRVSEALDHFAVSYYGGCGSSGSSCPAFRVSHQQIVAPACLVRQTVEHPATPAAKGSSSLDPLGA